MTAQSNPTTTTTDLITSRFLKVACPVKMAGNSRQLKGVAEDVESNNNAQIGRAVKVAKVLYAPEYLVRIKKARNAIAAQHLKMTSPWNDSSWRLLPTTGWFDYANAMNPLITEFDAAANELSSQYLAIVDEARHRLGDLFDVEDYPGNEQEFRLMFAADVRQEPLPQLSDTSRVSLPASEIEKIRKSLEESYHENIARTKAEVFDRLFNSTSALASSIKRWESGEQKSVKSTLIDTVKEAARYAQSFNLDNDPRIDSLLKDIQTLTTADMETIRENREVRASIVKAADDVADKAARRRAAMANMVGYTG